MKTAAQAFALASAFTAVYAQSAGNLIIQSPASLVQCQPALVSFSGGAAPYYISVLPGGQSTAAALEQFDPQNGNSYTWIVNLPAGQEVTLAIRDSTGLVNYSSQVPIQAGTDDSCLNGSAAPAGSASSAAPAGSASSSSSSSSSSSASSASVASSSSSSSATSAATTAATTSGRNANANASSSAPAPASTTPTGGAGKYLANMGAVAAVAGAVAFML